MEVEIESHMRWKCSTASNWLTTKLFVWNWYCCTKVTMFHIRSMIKSDKKALLNIETFHFGWGENPNKPWPNPGSWWILHSVPDKSRPLDHFQNKYFHISLSSFFFPQTLIKAQHLQEQLFGSAVGLPWPSAKPEYEKAVVLWYV